MHYLGAILKVPEKSNVEPGTNPMQGIFYGTYVESGTTST